MVLAAQLRLVVQLVQVAVTGRERQGHGCCSAAPGEIDVIKMPAERAGVLL